MSTFQEMISAGRSAIAALLAMAVKAESSEVVEVAQSAGRVGVILPVDRKWHDLTGELAAREQYLYDLEEKRGEGPRRIEARHVAETLEGFCDYVNRYRSSTTAISAQLRDGKPRLVATIDFHGASKDQGPVPRWGKHTVEYAFPFSVVFRQWQAASNLQDKKRFLGWVETHAVELAHPDEIVEAGKITSDIFHKVLIVRGWEKEKRAKAPLSAVFGSSQELFAGAKLMNGSTSEGLEETVDDMGQVSIVYKRSDKVENAVAKRYYLADIKVFDGDEDTRCVPVRLDLDVDGGKLVLSLHLIGVEQIVEASFLDACGRVEERTGIAPIRAVF